MGVVVRRYIDFLILLIPTPLFFFAAPSLLFVHFLKCFFRRKRRKKNGKSRFFTLGRVYVIGVTIAMLYTQSIGIQP